MAGLPILEKFFAFFMYPEQRFCPKPTLLGNRSHSRSQLNFSFRLKSVRLSENPDSSFQEFGKNVPKLEGLSEKSDKSDFTVTN